MAKKPNNERKDRTYKGEWWTVNSIMGNNWARFFALLGGREAGKSYAVMKWSVLRKLRKKDNVKLYWMRLTENQCENLLVNNASKLVDPDIQRKFGIKLYRKGSTVYSYTPVETIDRNGKPKIEKKDVRVFCDVLACSTMANTKGVAYFDNEYKGEYILVLDEMNREANERNCFDIVYNFVNLIENLTRSTTQKIKIIMIGNTLDEASDILAAFNFLPDGFGRFKLKKKLLVVDNIKPNEKYLERRKNATANIILPNASTFTNEVEIDRSLLVNRRLKTKPYNVIKFTKTKDTWFTLWNDGIIAPYNNEQKPVIAMRRYLDELYNDELMKSVKRMFDARAYKFVSLACLKTFQKNLKLLTK